jgi:BlaI family transcriptional regulator, penicillinase repressor
MRKKHEYLPPREQQILDLLHHHGDLNAKQVEALLPEPLSNSAIRSFLRSLEAKGRVEHREVEGTFSYRPTGISNTHGATELQRIVKTFFQGSVAAAMTALINPSDLRLTEEEFAAIQTIIEQSKTGGAK